MAYFCNIATIFNIVAMLKLAGMEKTVVAKKGFSAETQIGQFTIEMEKLG